MLLFCYVIYFTSDWICNDSKLIDFMKHEWIFKRSTAQETKAA